MTHAEHSQDSSAAERSIAELSYEEAKQELVAIVATLENGSATLEESMRLWERGEALATHCTQWLDQAQAAVDGGASAGTETGTGPA